MVGWGSEELVSELCRLVCKRSQASQGKALSQTPHLSLPDNPVRFRSQGSHRSAHVLSGGDIRHTSGAEIKNKQVAPLLSIPLFFYYIRNPTWFYFSTCNTHLRELLSGVWEHVKACQELWYWFSKMQRTPLDLVSGDQRQCSGNWEPETPRIITIWFSYYIWNLKSNHLIEVWFTIQSKKDSECLFTQHCHRPGTGLTHLILDEENRIWSSLVTGWRSWVILELEQMSISALPDQAGQAVAAVCFPGSANQTRV
jgi:hypothetical protein